jgi:hypothetical protein
MYAERIDNADELWMPFWRHSKKRIYLAVQLKLLTATVKCFLKNPEDMQEMVQHVLDMAVEESGENGGKRSLSSTTNLHEARKNSHFIWKGWL